MQLSIERKTRINSGHSDINRKMFGIAPMPVHNRRGLALAIILTLVWGFHACAGQRVDHRGRIRVLCMGDVSGQGGLNSFVIIGKDPAILPTFVPTRSDLLAGGQDAAIRNLKIYMPRTYDGLVNDYDVIMISAADDDVFAPEWIGWMSDSVELSGLGLLWLGPILYSGATDFDWGITTVGPVLPATQEPPPNRWASGAFWVRILDRNEPLMKALPWENSPPLQNVNIYNPKDGSRKWAVMESIAGSYPFMVFWEIGEGSALTMAPGFPAGVSAWAETWNLFPQAMMYQVYRVANKVLPEDPWLFQQVMNEFIEFSTMDSLVDSIIDWVEKFGGNTQNLRKRLTSVKDISAKGEEAYLSSDFGEALTKMHGARAEHILIREEATKAKDEALLWVYVIEWCTLLATIMISSYVLWALMVKRKLYREAGVSRLHLRE